MGAAMMEARALQRTRREVRFFVFADRRGCVVLSCAGRRGSAVGLLGVWAEEEGREGAYSWRGREREEGREDAYS